MTGANTFITSLTARSIQIPVLRYNRTFRAAPINQRPEDYPTAEGLIRGHFKDLITKFISLMTVYSFFHLICHIDEQKLSVPNQRTWKDSGLLLFILEDQKGFFISDKFQTFQFLFEQLHQWEQVTWLHWHTHTSCRLFGSLSSV